MSALGDGACRTASFPCPLGSICIATRVILVLLQETMAETFGPLDPLDPESVGPISPSPAGWMRPDRKRKREDEDEDEGGEGEKGMEEADKVRRADR